MTATPPRADLRTLAAEAKENTCDHPVYVHKIRGGEPLIVPICQLCGEIGWDDLREQMAAHRRMVLGEAADDLHRVATHLRATNPDSSVAKGVRYAEARIRAQLTAAPPAGLSVPVPAGTAPAVPEEADGQRPTEGDALNLYEVKVENEGDFRESLRQYDSRHLGHLVARRVSAVRALIAELRKTRTDRDRLAAQVAHYRRVVEAAKAWRGNRYASASILELAAAVDALPDAGTQPCPTPSDAKSGTDQTEGNHG